MSFAHPRRGGLAGEPVRIDPAAAQVVREITDAARPMIEKMIEDPVTDPEMAEATRAWLPSTW